MTIIDADTHLSPNDPRFAIDALLGAMDRAGVDRAVAWLAPDYCGPEIAGHNAYVFRAARQHPDRILGFGWADPTVGVDHARQMVRVCVDEYGLHGVKLNGAQNDYPIDDETLALPVIEEIARRETLLAFHVGADAYSNTHPYRVARIARRFPETTILMVHMGGCAYDDLSKEAIEVAQECANVLLIGSAVRPIRVLRALQALGPERVCFGSDTPFALMHVELAAYRALLADDFTPEERDLVLGGAIARALNL